MTRTRIHTALRIGTALAAVVRRDRAGAPADAFTAIPFAPPSRTADKLS